ncbi:hypothetical protein RBSWK_01159 [Rhodopirellula baltica SWK14]|uniref:Uncharacterized protein n=1 Tax=Rhodopirellula baltica SWK14 TaxID=993516 RepID=L7CP83_RHOBT|nr:hypothetical protein RBSWK_01159 [Rhodopirellula baltica SWK14]
MLEEVTNRLSMPRFHRMTNRMQRFQQSEYRFASSNRLPVGLSDFS